jgi:hypothetical protein
MFGFPGSVGAWAPALVGTSDPPRTARASRMESEGRPSVSRAATNTIVLHDCGRPPSSRGPLGLPLPSVTRPSGPQCLTRGFAPPPHGGFALFGKGLRGQTGISIPVPTGSCLDPLSEQTLGSPDLPPAYREQCQKGMVPAKVTQHLPRMSKINKVPITASE